MSNILSARHATPEPSDGYAADAPVIATMADGAETFRCANDDIEGGMVAFLAAGGTIEPFEPPAVEALRPLSPRLFWRAALTLGITEDMVDAKIEALPEPQRSEARIDKRHAQSYERTHLLVLSLPAQFNISPAALDAAWLAAQGN